MCDGEILNS